MIQMIFGIIFLLAPFILIFNYQDKVKGFLNVFIYVISAQIIIAVLTQVFHIFTHNVVFSINLIVSLFCIALFFSKKKYFTKVKLNWLLVLAVIIVIFELSSVHYFYTGIVNEADGYNSVSLDYYPYPSYSDEWSGVALADYSIEHKSLPLTNPLWYNKLFANGLVIFYAFISELFLLLNLSPLIGWTFFAVINGVIISFLIYLLLKGNKVSTFSSVVAMLSVPLIINGTNLPGIWFLTPFIFGFSVFLVSLICLSKKETVHGVLAMLVSLLIYPPLIVFVLPTLIAYKFRFALYSLIPIGLIGFSIIGLLSANFGFVKVWHIVLSWLIRPNLDGGGISILPIWIIIPFLLLPFIILGLISIYKQKKYLLMSPIVSGIFLWIFYDFYKNVIIIDQTRSVVIASILLIIPVGFGVESFPNYFKNLKDGRQIIIIIKTGFILVFIAVGVFYPGSDNWAKLILKVQNTEKITYYAPTSPITRYLYPDELDFFSKFSEKRFISPPWKGLALGVATHNYPLDSKASTIGNRLLKYYDFIHSDCEQKNKYVTEYKIDYVYGRSFDCPFFDEIERSQEGFYLYRINYSIKY